MINKHPIQLQGIIVKELFLKVYDPERAQENELDLPFSFKVGHSKFDVENNQIAVGVLGRVGLDADELGDDGASERTPFVIKVDLVGQFSVDVSLFPVDKVEQWAKENAPLILLPFLREHIYGLASRSGIKEVIVPMFVVPTVTINNTAK
ncbi:protein-export chaperone SecB [Undibacterium macrobrachii]|uniref:Preprotein translocase subunit SecB n=1 Tax=Undibacterium macrobrachii TaxID=1119058 RepID=A0ABQ2XF71_9BURK|nr:protein-export chaperone SecB [Undibacterium macrobrachii]GGX13996.1 hypothetical protein GCM10011282_20150 [Undibacterium macrobrachii]